MKWITYFILITTVLGQDLEIEIVSERIGNSNYGIKTLLTQNKNLEIDAKPLAKQLLNRSWTNNTPFIRNDNYKTSTVLDFLKKKTSFIDSDLFIIVVGSAVVFGTAAAYFKFESDKYYDQYQQTNNKQFLTKTNNYDIYSGVSLAAMEINFGYLIYRFLTD